MTTSKWSCALGLALLLAAVTPAGAATIFVAAGGNLQQALNAAQPGDTILLQEGAEFAGSFVLPVKSGAGWITLRTSAPDGVLPAAAVRIRPADAPLLARLRSTTLDAAALRTAAGAHHWRIEYLEFGANPWGQGDIIQIGDGSSAQNSLALVPHDIVFSHVYVHGDQAVGQKRGIALNAAAVTIVDSHISECKGVGQDTQAIAGWNGPGPFTIENNYLEGAGENVMFGGADPAVPGLVADGITFRRNYLSRPMSWRNPIIATPQSVTAASVEAGGSLKAGLYAYRVVARRLVNRTTMGRSTASTEIVATAAVDGSAIRLSWEAVPGATEYRVYGRTSGAQNVYWQVTTAEFLDTGANGTSEAVPTATGTVWSVKNLFELKNARNVVVEENVFENHWKESQPGWAIVLTPRNSAGACTWCVVENVRFERNLIRNVSSGINVLGYDSATQPTRQTNNLVFRQNLFRSVTTALGGPAWFIQLGDEPRDIVIEHNTVDANGTAVTYAYGGTSTDPREIYGFQMTANAARHNSYGINGAYFGYGNAILSGFFPGAVFAGNYLAGASASRYPAGTIVSGVFTDQFVDAAGGDFTLRPGSILKGAAPDGTDVGADYPALAAALVGVELGISTPAPQPPSPPAAAFTFSCTYLDCAFNDTSAAGSAAITQRSWTFGDSGVSTAASGVHAYAAAGTYTVVLTVTDANGLSDSESSTVTVAAAPPANVLPVAAFDYACADVTCSFTDRSSDSDGVVTAWSWAFGPAGTATSASPSFRFPAAGTYQVSLTVTDDRGGSSTVVRAVTVTTTIHAAFVSASSTPSGNGMWKATVLIAVHSSGEQPLPGATVAVSWTGGWSQNVTCVISPLGQCAFKTGAIKVQQPSVTLTITSVSAAGGTYDPAANHSAVAGATGSAVTIVKP
jgi:PKD repeat protein